MYVVVVVVSITMPLLSLSLSLSLSLCRVVCLFSLFLFLGPIEAFLFIAKVVVGVAAAHDPRVICRKELTKAFVEVCCCAPPPTHTLINQKIANKYKEINKYFVRPPPPPSTGGGVPSRGIFFQNW